MRRRQIEVDLGGDVVVVEADGEVAAEEVVLQAAVGGIGQVRLERLRDRRDAIGGDDVAGERVADEAGAVRIRPRRLRVVDDDRQRAEIPAPLRRGRDRHQPRFGLPAIAVAVVGREEEHAVARDRAAEREAVFVLIVVRLRLREERLRVERLVAEELEARAAELIRARLHDVVRCALAVVHDGRAARLDLELFDRFHRHAERQVAAFALHDGVGDRDAIDVGVVGEILSAHHVAPAADRLHAGHQEHERGRIARAAGVHHERKRRVDVIPDRLSEPPVRGVQRRRFGGDDDLLRDAADRQRGVQADHAERVDDHAFADELLEAFERHADAIFAGRERRQRVDAGRRRLAHGRDARGRVRRGDGGAWQRGAGRVEYGSLNRSAPTDLGARGVRSRDERDGSDDQRDGQRGQQSHTASFDLPSARYPVGGVSVYVHETPYPSGDPGEANPKGGRSSAM